MGEFDTGRFECFMIQVSASQDFGLEPLIYTDDTTPDNSVRGANQGFPALEAFSRVISSIYRRNWRPLSAQLDIPKQ